MIIKIIIAVGLICLLRIVIWRESKRNPYHLDIKDKLGNQAVIVINYSTLLLIGIGAIVVIFSYPNPFGLIIGGVLGLIGSLIGM